MKKKNVTIEIFDVKIETIKEYIDTSLLLYKFFKSKDKIKFCEDYLKENKIQKKNEEKIINPKEKNYGRN